MGGWGRRRQSPLPRAGRGQTVEDGPRLGAVGNFKSNCPDVTSCRALFKLIGGGIIVLAFAFWQTFGVWLRRWFPLAARRYANRVTSLGCRAFLRHWGVTVTLRNTRHLTPDRACLYAVNHLSYLDILVHGALFPSTFVTSREMHGTPFLGHICRFAQCFFVDRISRRRLAQEVRDAAALLESGVPVTLFPEGAASDGAGVQPFKSPLFKACLLYTSPSPRDGLLSRMPSSA